MKTFFEMLNEVRLYENEPQPLPSPQPAPQQYADTSYDDPKAIRQALIELNKIKKYVASVETTIWKNGTSKLGT